MYMCIYIHTCIYGHTTIILTVFLGSVGFDLMGVQSDSPEHRGVGIDVGA